MAYRRLNWFPGAWGEQAPGGGVSAELATSVEPVGRVDGGPSLRLTATTGAAGHRAEHAPASEDLTDVDELRLWVQSTRVGTGTDAHPLYLELRLGSGAVGLDDPANDWRRRLPVRRAGHWELVRLDVTDLPAAIRSDVDAVRIEVVDETSAFSADINAVFGARPSVVSDTTAALLDWLDGAVLPDGQAVTAVPHHSTGTAAPNAPPAGDRPAVQVRLERVADGSQRVAAPARDHTGDGYRVDGRASALALDFVLAPFTDDWDEQAAVLDLLVGAFAPRGELLAGGVPLPVEWRGIASEPLAGDRAVGRVRVVAALPIRPAVAIRPVDAIEVSVEGLPLP